MKLDFINKDLFSEKPILDSGASAITVPESFPLTEIQPNDTGFVIADGTVIKSMTKGYMNIGSFQFPAMTVEKLQTPLISIKVLTEHGFSILFNKEAVYALNGSETLLSPQTQLWKIGTAEDDGTYRLTEEAFSFFETDLIVSLQDSFPKLKVVKHVPIDTFPSDFHDLSKEHQKIFSLHVSLGHMSGKNMMKHQLISNKQIDVLKTCPQCIFYKFRRKPKVKSSHTSHSKQPHTRLCADMYYSENLFHELPRPAKNYVTLVIDEFSSYIHANSSDMKLASHSSMFINKVLRFYKDYHGHKALEFRTDKGNEFSGIDKSLIERDIVLAPTGDKERNGLAERFVNIHKTQRNLITAHVPQPLDAVFFKFSVHHAATLLNFVIKQSETECPYNLYHKTKKKLPTNLPVFLEDVICSITVKNKQTHVLGAFLYFDPHSYTCLLYAQHQNNKTQYVSIDASYYDLKRTYKLFSIKTFITEEMWKRNSTIWGQKPADWEDTFIDVVTNTSHSIKNDVSYFNSINLKAPTFLKENYLDINLKTYNSDPDRKGTQFDRPLPCPEESIFTNKCNIDKSQESQDTNTVESIDEETVSDTSKILQLTRNHIKEELVSKYNSLEISLQMINECELKEPSALYSVTENTSLDDIPSSIYQQTTLAYTSTTKPPKLIHNNIKGPWFEPTQQEKKKHIDMGVFKGSNKLPKDAILLRPLWVHTQKPNKLKSRMVCFNPKTVHITKLGNSAPVISSSGINILLSLAARQGLDVQFFDINNAFLYAYMKPGKYFIQTPSLFSDVFKTKYLELVKSTYGLQESPRAFYDHFSKKLTQKLGFKKNKYEPCLFHKNNDLLLSIHVDDGAIAGKPEAINDFFEQLQDEFQFKRTDCSYLGLDFEKTQNHSNNHYNSIKKWTRDEMNESVVQLQRPTEDATVSNNDPWCITQQEELTPPDPTPPKTSGYGKFKVLPEAYASKAKDVTVAFTVPVIPPPGVPVFTVSTSTHIAKFLKKFKEDNKHLEEFMKATPTNYDDILSEFAMPKVKHLDDFIEQIDNDYKIPDHWKHLFLNGKTNRSLLGSLSYFVYRSIPSLCFTVTILSRYNKFEHRTISYLIHCVIRQLQHIQCSLKFFRPINPPDYVNLICYSDASYNNHGKYYKGTYITLDHSPVLFKTATGRNKGKADSTTIVELEAAHDTYKAAIKLKNILLDIGIKVNMFLFVDNLPLLRSIHNNNETDITAGNVRLYDLRDAISEKVIKAGYVPGKENPADIYTKAFSKGMVNNWLKLESNKYISWTKPFDNKST